LTKAIEIKPDYALAYSNRGFTYGRQGDYESAITDYTKAIEINPDYAK
jgi:tetratricopeptide (TPR) repeat protein